MAGHEGAEDGPLGVRVYTDRRNKASKQGLFSYTVAVGTLMIYVSRRGGPCCTLPEAVGGALARSSAPCC